MASLEPVWKRLGIDVIQVTVDFGALAGSPLSRCIAARKMSSRRNDSRREYVIAKAGMTPASFSEGDFQ
jgi:hypothetical protein